MSYIVKLYTLRSMLGLNGLLNQMLLAIGILEKPSQIFLFNQRAVLITMAVIFMPFVILPIFLALERIPRCLLQASLDLGASGWDTFRHVVLPLSLPGTIAGALFTFVLALGDFITPQMVGGTTGFTIGRVICSQFGLAYNWPFGAAMAAILFLTALAGISSCRHCHEPAEGLNMRSTGERIVEFAAGVMTAAVFIILYAPLIIGVLFSVVQIRQGKILWETFSVSPYVTLWSNDSVLSALSEYRLCRTDVGRHRLDFGRAACALYRMGGRGRPPLHRTRHLSSLSSAADCHGPRSVGFLGRAWHQSRTSHHCRRPRGLRARRRLSPRADAAAGAPQVARRSVVRSGRWPLADLALCLDAASGIRRDDRRGSGTDLSFDETLITTFVAGDQMTLPLRLWAMMRVGFTPEINALVTLVLLVSIAFALVAAWRLKPKGEFEEE